MLIWGFSGVNFCVAWETFSIIVLTVKEME